MVELNDDKEMQAEYRKAWDQYASAYISGRLASGEGTTDPKTVTARAAVYADEMLTLRKQLIG